METSFHRDALWSRRGMWVLEMGKKWYYTDIIDKQTECLDFGLLTCVCWCCIAVITLCPLLGGWSIAQTSPRSKSTFICFFWLVCSGNVMIDICFWFGRWSLIEQPCCQTTGAWSIPHGNTSLRWQPKQSWWMFQWEWKLHLIWLQAFSLYNNQFLCEVKRWLLLSDT